MQNITLENVEKYIHDALFSNNTKIFNATCFFDNFATNDPNTYVQMMISMPKFTKNKSVLIFLSKL